jgi:hypothetical protein
LKYFLEAVWASLNKLNGRSLTWQNGWNS